MVELSVIIPVYNVEKYLRKCLESIINQSFHDMEIICVDDGSSDESGFIIDEYAHNDSRIIAIHQKNCGPMVARKSGVSIARGRFSIVPDSDDWIDKNMFEEMIYALREHNVDFVTSGFIREYKDKSIDGNEGIKKGLYKDKSYEQGYLSEFIGVNSFFEFNVPGSLCNKMIKTELLKTFVLRAPDKISIGSDAVVSYPLILNAKSVYVMGKNYYHYRIREGSITTKKCINEIENVKRVFEHVETESRKIKGYPILKRQIALWEYYILLCKWPELVISNQNGNVFPYRDVKISDRIIMYGMGRFGRFLFGYLQTIGMDVVGYIDEREGEDSIKLDELPSLEYDKIVITVLRASEVKEIRNILLCQGVSPNKIQEIDCDILLIKDIHSIIDKNLAMT